MRRPITALAVASAGVAGLAAAPTLYAHDSDGSGGSMMGPGMMGQMSAMLESCNRMMPSMNHSGSGKPNEQWGQDAPETDKAPAWDG